MALQFRPFVSPQDILATQPVKPNVGQEVSQGIQGALQSYLQLKAQADQQKLQQQQRNIEFAKNIGDYGSEFVDNYNKLQAQPPGGSLSPGRLSLFGGGNSPSVPQPGTPMPTFGQPAQPQQPAGPAQGPQYPQTAGAPGIGGQPVMTAPPPMNPAAPSPTGGPTAGTAIPTQDPTGQRKIPDSIALLTPDYLDNLKKTKGQKGVAEAMAQQKALGEQYKIRNEVDQNAPATVAEADAALSPYGDAGKNVLEKLKTAYPNGNIQKSILNAAITSLGGSVKQDYFGNIGDIKEQQLRQSLIKDARDTINPLFQTGPGKENVDRLQSIGRAEPLVNQMLAQPGGGDPRQMRELATSMDRVIKGGGSSAQSQIEELVPQTAKGKFANWKEWFTNDPTGTEQQAFIRRYAETLSREKTAIQGQIRNTAESNAPTLGTLKGRYPSDYKAVMDSVMNNSAYGGTSTGAPAPSAPQPPSAPSAALPPPAPGFVRIKASDNTMHDIPKNNFAAAQKIDPGATLVQ